MDIDYHPLLNNLIISRVIHYNSSIALKLVHPFWNEIHVEKFGKYPQYLQPWIKTHKILKKMGTKYETSDSVDDVFKKKLVICIKMGLLIEATISNSVDSVLYLYFIDFTGRFCVKKSVRVDCSNFCWTDVLFFPPFFCKDHKNHYLVSVKFESRLYVFDYSDLKNISVQSSEQSTLDREIRSAFSVVFGKSYYFYFQPERLNFFDVQKFYKLTKDVEQRILMQAKFFHFNNACYLIGNTNQNTIVTKFSLDNEIEYTTVLCSESDTTKKCESFKFWSHYLLLVCHSVNFLTTIVLYDLSLSEPFKEPYFFAQLPIEYFTYVSVIPMNDDLIAFHQTNKLIVLDASTKKFSGQINNSPKYLKSVNRFFPSERNNIFFSFQRKSKNYARITFDLESQSFTRTKNFSLLDT